MPQLSESGDSYQLHVVDFTGEARESKAFARERLMFRLAQASGSAIPAHNAQPIAPASASARAAIGNPLGSFLLQALEHSDGPPLQDR